MMAETTSQPERQKHHKELIGTVISNKEAAQTGFLCHAFDLADGFDRIVDRDDRLTEEALRGDGAELREPVIVSADENGAQLSSLHRVTLTAKWKRAGTDQSQQIEFYVYRPG